MQLSSLPLLIAVVFGFLWFLVSRLHRAGILNSDQRNQMALLIGVILMWGMFIGYQSSVGRFGSEPFYNLMPGYWMPYVPVVVALSMMLSLAPLRDGLRVLVDETPVHWLSGIHILRILALGTLLKASNDLFPQMFAWFVGGPDLLFGVSAIIVTLLARSGRLSDRFILYWHLAGALAIVLPVAGLMHLFMAEPLFAELFMFPMVMAPALIVPTLVLLNLLVAWRFYEQGALNQ
ncbi:MAG: hypothetical protein N0C90_00175 [Candidatus Thiodiazotropha endolucinida]|nr:hypothetical protein [Candidatus Thiodiazotropha taylori]MCW4259760.1 hypothetical protein [Candidatus Thiodiazotropha endolucinida]